MNNIKRIQAALGGYGLDAVLLTGEHNRFYAAGFSSTAGVWVIGAGAAYFFVDSRYIEAARAKITGAEVHLCESGQSYGQLIENAIHELGIRRLGFEDQVMSVAEYSALKERLSAELVPAQELLSALRAVKSPEEAEKMRAAQRIAEAAFQDILPKISPEITEKRLAAELEYAMLCHGADGKSFDTIVVSGEKTSMPHGCPEDRKLRPGFLTIDFGCVKDGYCSDTTRTLCLGKATEEMRQVYQTVLEAQQAGILAARAGVTGREVDMAGRTVITEAGFGPYFGHSFGHGLGLEIHEAPNASSVNLNQLPAGAFISAEPGIYLPGRFGVRIEDVLHLTGDGCEDITHLPKALLEL